MGSLVPAVSDDSAAHGFHNALLLLEVFGNKIFLAG